MRRAMLTAVAMFDVGTMHRDIALISSCVLLPPNFQVGGFIFDVHSGELVPVES